MCIGSQRSTKAPRASGVFRFSPYLFTEARLKGIVHSIAPILRSMAALIIDLFGARTRRSQNGGNCIMSHTSSFRDITTLRVGGSIARIEHVGSADDFITLLSDLKKRGIHSLVVGGGSNILAHDAPFEGVVVTPTFAGVSFEESATGVRVIADAGLSWDALVQMTVERGLWGLENLSAIPGTVGAAPMQNIGAYGADVSDTIEWVEVYDTHQNTNRTLSNADLHFGYRTSILKEERGRYAVTRVSFLLSKTPQPNLSYKDLTHAFMGIPNPDSGAIRDAVIRIRASKFPNLKEHGTAGSFFMNPILSSSDAEKIINAFPEIPNFKDGQNIKFSLAWILDNVVHAKGMSEGNAFVWEKQPLVIATKDFATGDDVRALMHALQEKVFEKTNIKIIPEVFVM